MSELSRQELLDTLMAMRDIETLCPKCGGWGTRAYGSTSTWKGGIGGQAITSDVCDKCWGSGDAYKTWANLSRIRGMQIRTEMLEQDRERLLDLVWDLKQVYFRSGAAAHIHRTIKERAEAEFLWDKKERKDPYP